MYRRVCVHAITFEAALDVGGKYLALGPALTHAWQRQLCSTPALLSSPTAAETSPFKTHRSYPFCPHYGRLWHGPKCNGSRAIGSMATGASGKSDSPSEQPEPSDQHILRQLLVHLWPKDNPEFRTRVVGALGLLVGSKLLNIQACPCNHSAAPLPREQPPRLPRAISPHDLTSI